MCRYRTDFRRVSVIVESYLLLTGNALVLLEIARNPSASVRVLAARTDLSHRSVERILARLVARGVISRQWQGHRMLTTIIDRELPFPIAVPIAGDEAIPPVLQVLADPDGEDEPAPA